MALRKKHFKKKDLRPDGTQAGVIYRSS